MLMLYAYAMLRACSPPTVLTEACGLLTSYRDPISTLRLYAHAMLRARSPPTVLTEACGLLTSYRDPISMLKLYANAMPRACTPPTVPGEGVWPAKVCRGQYQPRPEAAPPKAHVLHARKALPPRRVQEGRAGTRPAPRQWRTPLGYN